MNVRLLAAVAAVLSIATPASAQVLTLGTNPQGSQIFSAGAAVAKVATEKLKMQLRVQPMAGSSTYIPLINTGEVDFGVANVEETTSSIAGRGQYEGKPNPNLRLVTVLFQLPVSILVAGDSPAKSIKDLKGMRVGGGFAGQTIGRVLTDALLASGGLTINDVRTVPVVNLFQAVEVLGKGNLDAAVIGPGTGQIQQANLDLSSRGGVRFLGVDASPEALAAMRKYIAAKTFMVDPLPQFVGVQQPTRFLGYSMFLLASNKVPDATVYNLVKMLNGSREDLVKITPVLQRFDPKSMSENVAGTWHPGAIKFYGEVGQWPPAS
jgi:TRAP transporter TAXI family solute receptor